MSTYQLITALKGVFLSFHQKGKRSIILKLITIHQDGMPKFLAENKEKKAYLRRCDDDDK